MFDNEYIVNKTIIKAKIVKITNTYILASFNDKVGICHISNVSDYIVKDINLFLKKMNFIIF